MLVPIIPDDHSPPKTFLNRSQDLLGKLRWEVDCLENTLRAGDRTAVYFAFNAAVTAWHISDWAWQELSKAQRQHLTAELKIEGNFTSFQNHIRTKCRALHLCRQVATGSKHRTVKRYDDPSVLAYTSSLWSLFSHDPSDLGKARLIICDGDVIIDASVVFDEASRFWHRFLMDIGLMEDSFVLPETESER